MNNKDEIQELNHTSQIISRFLSEGEIEYTFSLYDHEEGFGLEHIYTVEDEYHSKYRRKDKI
jgi:hypothetical protein